MKITSFLLFSLLGLTSLTALAQTVPNNSESKSKTELEVFQEKYGSVIVKGFTDLPAIRGLGGTFKITVREFRDPATTRKIKGLQVEVDTGERYSSSAASFIEYGEIDSLIKGIDYVAKIDKSVTTLANFEAQYKTKGEFEITVFNDLKGELSVALRAGRIGAKTVFFTLATLPKVVAQLQEAKAMLDAL